MASHTQRYTELASYREQIQLASRKFRWSPVYMYRHTIPNGLCHQPFHDSHAHLDNLDTTLYGTVLDASALRPNPRQCSQCNSFDHLVKDCAFPPPEQTKKTTGNGKTTSWKYTKWYAPSGQEGCNLFERNACYQGANQVLSGEGGPLHSLPEVHSPFLIDVWRESLRNHPSYDFVNELLHDIKFGVRIGFHRDRTPLISSNYPSTTANPAPVPQELERELRLNRNAGPFLAPQFPNFDCSPMGAIPKKTLAASQMAYH